MKLTRDYPFLQDNLANPVRLCYKCYLIGMFKDGIHSLNNYHLHISNYETEKN